jgi:hypothetical protein
MVPQGHYRLTSDSGISTSMRSVLLPGAVFTGPAFPPGETDGAALSGEFGFSLLSASTAGGNSGTLHASLAVGASREAIDYEKMGIYARVVTSDGSVYGRIHANRDAVGVESQCSFSAAIQTGRCWAFDSITGVPRGTDGYAVGDEIMISNFGGDQPAINQSNSKIGLHLVAGGDRPATAGIILSAARGGRWHDALVVKRSAVSEYAVVVRDDSETTFEPITAISMAGDAMFHDVLVRGALRRVGAQRDVPEQGGLVSIGPGVDTEIVAPGSDIESARVALPVGQAGAGLRILCVARIAHLAVTSIGGSVHGQNVMPCAPGMGHEYAFYPSDGWIQIY